MPKLELPPSEALYPVPVVLVSCGDKAREHPNIITIAWCGVVCSSPPLLSISIRPSRYSHKIIKDTGDFVINIPSKDLLDKVDLCGTVSGKDIDKFKACSFKEIPAKIVSGPMIRECRVNIECKLKTILHLGAHDMFIGEVVALHADEEVINSSGSIDYKKAAPIVYNQGEYWDLGEKIGYYGCSRK